MSSAISSITSAVKNVVSDVGNVLTGGSSTVTVEDDSDGVVLTSAEEEKIAETESKRKARKATSGTSTVLTSPLGTTSAASTISKTLGA